MASLNINSAHHADKHYRYKMAALDAKQDGRSKQRKTFLLNLPEIARQLRRSPELLIQWISLDPKCAGTTGGFDSSSGQPRWYIKGHHDTRTLQESLNALCGELVVCQKCGDCGTRLYTVNEGGTKKKPIRRINMSCGACGAEAMTARQDPKLARHLPDRATPFKEEAQGKKESRRSTEEKAVSRKSQKKSSKSSKKDEKKGGTKAEEEDEEEIEWFTDFSKEAVAARRSEALNEESQFKDATAPSKDTVNESLLALQICSD